MKSHIIEIEGEKVMFKISEHIYKEINFAKMNLTALEEKTKKELLKIIQDKYINKCKRSVWLWEKLIQFEAMQDSNAWKYIKDFVKDRKCIMFFNQDEDEEMFLFESGNDLNYVLSETCGFEFYITDLKCSYLICFNHHDVLYGCGSAREWIKRCKFENH